MERILFLPIVKPDPTKKGREIFLGAFQKLKTPE